MKKQWALFFTLMWCALLPGKSQIAEDDLFLLLNMPEEASCCQVQPKVTATLPLSLIDSLEKQAAQLSRQAKIDGDTLQLRQAWLKQAQCAIARHQIPRARNYLQKAGQGLAPDSTVNYVRYLIVRGQLQQSQLHLDSALVTYAQALVLCQGLPTCQQERAFLHYLTGVLHYHAQRYKKALVHFKQALAGFLNTEKKAYAGYGYQAVGTAFYLLRNYSKATENYQRAIQVLQQTGPVAHLQLVYLNMGLLYIQQANYPLALQYLQKHLRLSDKEGLRNKEAASLLHLGRVFMALQEYRQAEQYFNNALNLLIQLNNKPGIAYVYHHLGQVFFMQQQPEQALDYFQKSLNLHNETQNTQGRAENHLRIARIYTQQGYHQEAREHLISAQTLARQGAHHHLLAQSLSRLASMNLDGKNYGQAIRQANKALQLARENKNYEAIKYAAQHLSDAYAGLGNYAMAFKYHKAFKTASDSLLQVEKNKQIASIEYQLEYQEEKQQQEILHQRKNSLYAAEIERQKRFKNSFFFAFIILVGLLVFFARNYRMKQRANWDLREKNDLISRQNEEIRALNSELKATIQHLQNTQKQLIHSEKMASIGTLTAGVAHEINNPLNFINGGLTIISQIVEEHPLAVEKDERELFNEAREMIQMGINRATKIIKSMAAFTATSSSRRQDSDINLFIDNSLLFLKSKIPSDVTIEKNYRLQSTFPIYQDKFHQIVVNIITNALFELKAMDSDQEKFLRFDTFLEHHQGQRVAVIIISNSGPRIPDYILPKLFDPFFTTKGPQEGIGLGLAIVHSMVQEHHGVIEANNTHNGVSFVIKLPEGPSGQ